jgi:hypothetical protein
MLKFSHLCNGAVVAAVIMSILHGTGEHYNILLLTHDKATILTLIIKKGECLRTFLPPHSCKVERNGVLFTKPSQAAYALPLKYSNQNCQDAAAVRNFCMAVEEKAYDYRVYRKV